MLSKLARFHEQMLAFVQESNTASFQLMQVYLPKIIFIVFFSIANVMLLNGQVFNQQEHYRAETIASFMAEQDDTVLQQIEGLSYEYKDNQTVHEVRIHGAQQSYRFYFLDDTHHIVNELTQEWETKPLPIPPVISKAFIHWDVGVVEEYDPNGHVQIADDKLTLVDYSFQHVTYQGNTFSPLPALPTRVVTFIEDETGQSLDTLSLMNLVRTASGEELLIMDDTHVYQVDVQFDSSATIGTVSFEKNETNE